MHMWSCGLSGWLGSGFFFTMHIRDAQSLRDLEMHQASSRSLISSLMKVLYFKGMVYSFVETSGPVVGRSISMRLVCPKSVEDLEIISANLLVSIVLSLCWISNGTFAAKCWCFCYELKVDVVSYCSNSMCLCWSCLHLHLLGIFKLMEEEQVAVQIVWAVEQVAF